MYNVRFGLAVPRDENEGRLCYDVALQRDEWPWIGKSIAPTVVNLLLQLLLAIFAWQ